MPKKQRIRDPIHGLVAFDDEPAQLVWRLLNCREFQRLRRIKQLGFCDFVYPGATHSRFSHSVGVFENARRLLKIIERNVGHAQFDQHRAVASLCGALLHDVGHGPFSHTFEGVQHRLQRRKKHENWSEEIILGDSEVNKELTKFGEQFPKEVAGIIREEPRDIYSVIISSQFDADRLDYLVRDRYMTGVEVGHFDMEWLLDCLEVGDILLGGQEDIVRMKGPVLNYKGFKAAEGYLEARYQLYAIVYLHKTTRSAEKMLAAFLELLSRRLKDNSCAALNLPASHPLVQFLKSDDPEGDAYLRLDDASVWSLLEAAKHSKDKQLAEFGSRILDRRLFKCFDVGAHLKSQGGDLKYRFMERLRNDAKDLNLERHVTLLEDEPRLTGYDWYSWTEESALKKVLIQDIERNENIDIGDRSEIIKALKKEEFCRVYVPNEDRRERIEAIWKGLMA